MNFKWFHSEYRKLLIEELKNGELIAESRFIPWRKEGLEKLNEKMNQVGVWI